MFPPGARAPRKLDQDVGSLYSGDKGNSVDKKTAFGSGLLLIMWALLLSFKVYTPCLKNKIK